ncbi:MAG: hypothetical protein Q7T59_01380 [Candidatus Woesebacteria bacterium]|nr:hypothetical protein [Candidatus Woesebacteria bacterium]
MKKYHIRITLLILVLITLVFTFLYIYVFPKTCPEPTLIPQKTLLQSPGFTVDSKTGLQTYISNADKFTISYSTNWKVNNTFILDSHANLVLISDKFPETVPQLGVGQIYIQTKVNDKNLPLMNWLKIEDEKHQNYFQEYYPYKETRINDLPAVTSEIFWTQDFINWTNPLDFGYYAFPLGTVHKTVYFQNDDLIISIGGRYTTNTNAFLKELNQIISTFKFIQPYQ